MSTNIDKGLILNNIKAHYKFNTETEFAKFLGIPKSTLSSWRTRNSFDYELLYSKCDQIDGNWLITGSGKMLRKEAYNLEENNILKFNEDHVKYISKGDDEIHSSDLTVPLYDIPAKDSMVEFFGNIHKQVSTEYLRIPKLPNVDGAMYITGDSMYPLLKAGDIIIYKVINDIKKIIWGEMYLVYINHNEDEYFITKYLHPSGTKGYIKFISQNPHYKMMEFPQESIKALALIKAFVRLNISI